MYAREGQSGLGQTSVLVYAARVERQAQYVGGVQGVVAVNPVCMLEGAYDGWAGTTPGCSTMVLPQCHLQTETGSTRKKGLSREKVPHPDWQSTLVSDGEPA